jgi:hypothetical protein
MNQVNFVDDRQRRSESYLLRLTRVEHEELRRLALIRECSIADVIRAALDCHTQTESPRAKRKTLGKKHDPKN